MLAGLNAIVHAPVAQSEKHPTPTKTIGTSTSDTYSVTVSAKIEGVHKLMLHIAYVVAKLAIEQHCHEPSHADEVARLGR